jgi:hypothetical protein
MPVCWEKLIQISPKSTPSKSRQAMSTTGSPFLIGNINIQKEFEFVPGRDRPLACPYPKTLSEQLKVGQDYASNTRGRQTEPRTGSGQCDWVGTWRGTPMIGNSARQSRRYFQQGSLLANIC